MFGTIISHTEVRIMMEVAAKGRLGTPTLTAKTNRNIEHLSSLLLHYMAHPQYVDHFQNLAIIKAFISQCAHETNGFTVFEEDIRYSNAFCKFVKEHKQDIVSSNKDTLLKFTVSGIILSAIEINNTPLKEYASKPDLFYAKLVELANLNATAKTKDQLNCILIEAKYGRFSTIGSRMGNNAPGDGVKYIGRGCIQLTGKNNYVQLKHELAPIIAQYAPGCNIVDNPKVVSTNPHLLVLSALDFWRINKCSKAFVDGITTRGKKHYSEYDAVTYKINSGELTSTNQHTQDMLQKRRNAYKALKDVETKHNFTIAKFPVDQPTTTAAKIIGVRDVILSRNIPDAPSNTGLPDILFPDANAGETVTMDIPNISLDDLLFGAVNETADLMPNYTAAEALPAVDIVRKATTLAIISEPIARQVSSVLEFSSIGPRLFRNLQPTVVANFNSVAEHHDIPIPAAATSFPQLAADATTEVRNIVGALATTPSQAIGKINGAIDRATERASTVVNTITHNTAPIAPHFFPVVASLATDAEAACRQFNAALNKPGIIEGAIVQLADFAQDTAVNIMQKAVTENISTIFGVDNTKAAQLTTHIINGFTQLAGSNPAEKYKNLQDNLKHIVNLQGLRDMQMPDLKNAVTNVGNLLTFVEGFNIPGVNNVTKYAKGAMGVYAGIAAFKTAQSAPHQAAAIGAVCDVVCSFLPPNSKLSNALKGAASGAMAGAAFPPYGMIIGAAFGVVSSLFGKKNSGPSSTEIIMRGIQQLSHQISNLHEAMNEQFQNLHTVLGENFKNLHEHIQNGFVNLNENMREYFRAYFKQLNEHLEAQFSDLRNLLNEHFKIVAENFRTVQSLQISTMRMISDGFKTLLQHFDYRFQGLSQQIDAFRQEMSESLEVIGDSICAGILQQHTGNIQILLHNYGKILATSTELTDESVVISPSEFRTRLMTVDAELKSIVAARKTPIEKAVSAYNPLLTGATIMTLPQYDDGTQNRLSDPSLLPIKSFITFIGNCDTPFSAEQINSFLGYLLNNTGNYTRNDNANDMLNPFLWHRAIEQYLALRQRYPNFFATNDRFAAEKILQQGIDIYKTVDLLNSNSNLWISLFNEYYNIVTAIKNTSIKFATAVTVNVKVGLDHNYGNNFVLLSIFSDEKLDQAADTLAAQFTKRTINKWRGEFATQPVMDRQLQLLPGTLLDKSPLTSALTSKIPTEILAAEYLGLLFFSNLEQIAAPTRLTSDNTDLQLPIKFLVTCRSFIGENVVTCKVSTTLIGPGPTAGVNDETTFCDHIIREWRDGNSANYRVLAEPVFTPEFLSHTRKQITQYLLEQRRIIANKLLGNATTADPTETKYLQEFNNLLDILNFRARLIQCYAYLFGKVFNSEAFLTREAMICNLWEYVTNENITLDRSFIGNIDITLSTTNQRLSFELFKSLPSSPQPLTHPLRLLADANSKLADYIRVHDITLLVSPISTRHFDIDHYQQQCWNARFDIFQAEIYKWLETSYSHDFQDAKNSLLNIGLPGNMTIQNFIPPYQAIRLWAMTTSVQPFFTCSNVQDSNAYMSSLSELRRQIDQVSSTRLENILLDLNNTMFLSERLKLGWERNTGLLRNIFKSHGFKVDAIAEIPYPEMWYDGVSCLLQIFSSKKFDEVSVSAYGVSKDGHLPADWETNPLHKIEAAKKAASNRVVDLDRCFKLGKNLQNLMVQIGLSYEFFEQIFTTYANKLTELTTLIRTMQHPANGAPRNNSDCMQLLQHPAAAGPFSTGTPEARCLDQITACQMLISSYIQMCFGYDLTQQEDLQILSIFALNRAQLLKFLQTVADHEPTGTNLDATLICYRERVLSLLQQIKYCINNARDILALQYYLETYFIDNSEAYILRIENLGGTIFRNGITVDALKLIDQFLSKHIGRILILEFIAIELHTEHLEYLANMLQRYPTITGLKLISAKLDIETLYHLKSGLSQITLLDLRNNMLGTAITAPESPAAMTLIDTLYLAPLIELNLATNDFNTDGLHTILTTTQIHQNLTSLDLNANPKLLQTINTAIPQLVTLLNSHKFLHTLNLANTGLTAEFLVTWHNMTCNNTVAQLELPQLQQLDISHNTIYSDLSLHAFINFIQKMPKLKHFIILGISPLEQNIKQYKNYLANIFTNVKLAYLTDIYTELSLFANNVLRHQIDISRITNDLQAINVNDEASAMLLYSHNQGCNRYLHYIGALKYFCENSAINTTSLTSIVHLGHEWLAIMLTRIAHQKEWLAHKYEIQPLASSNALTTTKFGIFAIGNYDSATTDDTELSQTGLITTPKQPKQHSLS